MISEVVELIGCLTVCFQEFADGFDKYDGLDDMFHEAGYDAYVTGCALITMTMYLGESRYFMTLTTFVCFMADSRHHSLNVGNIHKAERDMIHLNVVTVLWSSKNYTDIERGFFSGSILQVACPCLPPTTVVGHVVVVRPLPLPQFLRNVV